MNVTEILSPRHYPLDKSGSMVREVCEHKDSNSRKKELNRVKFKLWCCGIKANHCHCFSVWK